MAAAGGRNGSVIVLDDDDEELVVADRAAKRKPMVVDLEEEFLEFKALLGEVELPGCANEAKAAEPVAETGNKDRNVEVKELLQKQGIKVGEETEPPPAPPPPKPEAPPADAAATAAAPPAAPAGEGAAAVEKEKAKADSAAVQAMKAALLAQVSQLEQKLVAKSDIEQIEHFESYFDLDPPAGEASRSQVSGELASASLPLPPPPPPWPPERSKRRWAGEWSAWGEEGHAGPHGRQAPGEGAWVRPQDRAKRRSAEAWRWKDTEPDPGFGARDGAEAPNGYDRVAINGVYEEEAEEEELDDEERDASLDVDMPPVDVDGDSGLDMPFPKRRRRAYARLQVPPIPSEGSDEDLGEEEEGMPDLELGGASPSAASSKGSTSPKDEAALRRRQRAIFAFQAKVAAKIRDALVIQWREVSRPRRGGAISAKPPGARLDFLPLFKRWLKARGLSGLLEQQPDSHGWMVFRYKRDPIVALDDTWEVAFHGTWWYAVWSVLESGVLLESDDHGKGHDFWEPGVYCSPNRTTARWYARPQIMFGDGVYHRLMFELRVDPKQRKRNRQRGGVQWVFPTSAICLHSVWVQVNAPPKNGEERVNEWDPSLEALPAGRKMLKPTRNPRDLATDPYPEIPDERWNEEDSSVPPHLLASNPVPTPPAHPPSAAHYSTASLGSKPKGPPSLPPPHLDGAGAYPPVGPHHRLSRHLHVRSHPLGPPPLRTDGELSDEELEPESDGEAYRAAWCAVGQQAADTAVAYRAAAHAAAAAGPYARLRRHPSLVQPSETAYGSSFDSDPGPGELSDPSPTPRPPRPSAAPSLAAGPPARSGSSLSGGGAAAAGPRTRGSVAAALEPAPADDGPELPGGDPAGDVRDQSEAPSGTPADLADGEEEASACPGSPSGLLPEAAEAPSCPGTPAALLETAEEDSTALDVLAGLVAHGRPEDAPAPRAARAGDAPRPTAS